MTIILSAEQCRVIGVMLEKETTTPEQYPLSLNGLTNACNQKSNREPVMSLTESQVQDILDELVAMKLVSDQGAFSGRVAKYQHRFCNTEFGDLQFSLQQRAIICVLLLRGPQTPGELRTRTNRLAEFVNVNEVETALNQLHDLNGNEYVFKLAKEPGKRESRYAHLFTEFKVVQSKENDLNTDNSDSDMISRIVKLENQVENLTRKLTELLEQLG